LTAAVLFAIGLVLLYVGGEGLVRASAALGIRFGLTPMVAGLTIVASATSAPELAISVDAALRDIPGLSVGNVVGSNICNIAFIFGLTAILRPCSLQDQLIRRDVLAMLLCTLLVPALLLDNELARLEGGLLAIGIVGYIFLTVWHTRVSTQFGPPQETLVPTLTLSIPINCALAAGSVVMLVFGSELFVQASVVIAGHLGVPAAVVGLSAAALGSSLPELSASIIAARHGHPEMAAGNLIGSNVFNLLMILGVTSLLRPINGTGVSLVDYGVMIGVTILALTLMLTKRRVERYEGAILVAIYVLYLFWLFAHSAEP
jgi:cation:H+ antiporter